MRMELGLATAHRIIDISQIAADFLKKELPRKLYRPSGASRRKCLNAAFVARQTLQLIDGM